MSKLLGECFGNCGRMIHYAARFCRSCKKIRKDEANIYKNVKNGRVIKTENKKIDYELAHILGKNY